ncbi:stress response protein nst1-related [Anaeramoeba flamelloides]|uniref:Stress response protein nst1-related n=1 Tax=Anaeramoeba flamelloides TaxID=1746091 RepID=A0ABQ8ZE92_9EUKA|nr:stress response protein nst1-related [Anaeramoeba flamelloides]
MFCEADNLKYSNDQSKRADFSDSPVELEDPLTVYRRPLPDLENVSINTGPSTTPIRTRLNVNFPLGHFVFHFQQNSTLNPYLPINFSVFWYFSALVLILIQQIFLIVYADKCKCFSINIPIIVTIIVVVFYLSLFFGPQYKTCYLKYANNALDETSQVSSRTIYLFQIFSVFYTIQLCLFLLILRSKTQQIRDHLLMGNTSSDFFVFQIIVTCFTVLVFVAKQRIFRPADRHDPLRTILDLENVSICFGFLDACDLFFLAFQDNASIPKSIEPYLANTAIVLWFLSNLWKLLLTFSINLPLDNKFWGWFFPINKNSNTVCSEMVKESKIRERHHFGLPEMKDNYYGYQTLQNEEETNNENFYQGTNNDNNNNNNNNNTTQTTTITTTNNNDENGIINGITGQTQQTQEQDQNEEQEHLLNPELELDEYNYEDFFYEDSSQFDESSKLESKKGDNSEGGDNDGESNGSFVLISPNWISEADFDPPKILLLRSHFTLLYRSHIGLAFRKRSIIFQLPAEVLSLIIRLILLVNVGARIDQSLLFLKNLACLYTIFSVIAQSYSENDKWFQGKFKKLPQIFPTAISMALGSISYLVSCFILDHYLSGHYKTIWISLSFAIIALLPTILMSCIMLRLYYKMEKNTDYSSDKLFALFFFICPFLIIVGFGGVRLPILYKAFNGFSLTQQNNILLIIQLFPLSIWFFLKAIEGLAIIMNRADSKKRPTPYITLSKSGYLINRIVTKHLMANMERSMTIFDILSGIALFRLVLSNGVTTHFNNSAISWCLFEMLFAVVSVIPIMYYYFDTEHSGIVLGHTISRCLRVLIDPASLIIRLFLMQKFQICQAIFIIKNIYNIAHQLSMLERILIPLKNKNYSSLYPEVLKNDPFR